MSELAEKAWDQMTAPEIEAFLHANPTYFMGPEEASNWWAGVEGSIRADQERRITGRAERRGKDYKAVNVGSQANPRIEQVWKD